MQTTEVQERVRSYELTDAESEFISKCLTFWRNWTPIPCCDGYLLYEKLNPLFSRPPGER